MLLCDVASALTGVAVSGAVVPPLVPSDARANLMLALDHLGLLGDMDEAAAAAAASALMPRAPPRVAAALAGGDLNPGAMVVNPRGASYSARHRERRVVSAVNVVVEVDRVMQVRLRALRQGFAPPPLGPRPPSFPFVRTCSNLTLASCCDVFAWWQGRPEAPWALLNHVREVANSRQPYLGPSTHMASARAAAARAAAGMQVRALGLWPHRDVSSPWRRAWVAV